MSHFSNWPHNELLFEFICHVQIDLGCRDYEHILWEQVSCAINGCKMSCRY